METQLPGGVQLNTRDTLRLNVGFLLYQSVGFSRIFDFDIPQLSIDDLQLTSFTGNTVLTRTVQGLYVQGEFTAISPQQCVRCLDDYDQELTAELAELFAYPPSTATDPQLVVPATGILDLGPTIREIFLLAHPLRPICKPDCKALCPVCGNNRNLSECEHPDSDIDPRFLVLKTLLPKQ